MTDEPDETGPAPDASTEAERPAQAPAEAGDSLAAREMGTDGAETFEEPAILPPEEVRAVIEALIFAAPQPLTPREIARVLGDAVQQEAWTAALEALRDAYAQSGRGLQLVEVADGFQITTRPEYNDWIRELLRPKAPTRLSVQALETLAVIAYKQPVTLPEIIELRGVKSGGVIKTLLERRLIRIIGRKEVVGRPMLYGTTKEFLLHFGLKDLLELPKIEEFAEVLGEEIDIDGLKRAIAAPQPSETALSEAEPSPDSGQEGMARGDATGALEDD